MTTMYDSVTPTDIPTTVAIVAGYVDGSFAWDAAGWARFPGALHVRIATQASTVNGCDVLDVETGDATATQAVQWAKTLYARGQMPIVYCNLSTWPAVIDAFHSAGVAQPLYWIAHYNGDPTIPAGACAVQYADPPNSGGHWDLSEVDQLFINVIQGYSVTQPQLDIIDEQAEAARVAAIARMCNVADLKWAGTPANIATEINELAAAINKILANQATILSKLDALASQSAVSGTFTISGSGTVS